MTLPTLRAALAAIAVLASVGHAAEADAAKEDPFAAMRGLYREIEKEVDGRLRSGDYLGGVAAAAGFIERETDRRRLGFLLDLNASYVSTLGEDARARLSMARSRTAYIPGEPARVYPDAWTAAAKEVRWREPEAVLRAAARKHGVIMFSEAHHIPEHRAFGARMLPLLRKLGYTHFAMEALRNPQAYERPLRVGASTGPATVAGGYLVEPQFANLVRTAVALGFELVAYEDTGSDDREKSQAANLYEAVLKENPDAKVVVWAGYAHIYKRQLRNWKTMAVWLWEMTGQEPFCLYQVHDGLDPYASDEPFYKPLVHDAKRPLKRPMVLENVPGLFPKLDAVGGDTLARTEQGLPAVDGYVVHPPLAPRAPGGLRPGWMDLMTGARRINGTLAPAEVERIVQAFPAREGTASSPADQMIPERSGAFELRLNPGAYILRVRDATGAILLERPAEIPPGRRPLELGSLR